SGCNTIVTNTDWKAAPHAEECWRAGHFPHFAPAACSRGTGIAEAVQTKPAAPQLRRSIEVVNALINLRISLSNLRETIAEVHGSFDPILLIGRLLDVRLGVDSAGLRRHQDHRGQQACVN